MTAAAAPVKITIKKHILLCNYNSTVVVMMVGYVIAYR
jgi:hypothetical protein